MSYVETHLPPPDRPNPQKRNLLINRLKKAPWWLLVILLALTYIVGELAKIEVYETIWYGLEEGIRVTVRVSIRAYAFALIFGLLIALMRLSNNFFLYQFSTLYVEVIRGIPTLILVIYVALGLTPELVKQANVAGAWLVDQQVTIWGIGAYFKTLHIRDPSISLERRVVLALAVSYSAFLSEIFRAGIQSIDRGQIEAAKSLGLKRPQVMMLVVLPQAFRIILPPLGNDFIAMLKESSLVSVVGVEDITRRGRTMSTATFRVFETYNVVALTYLALTLTLALIVKIIEWHFDERSPKPQWYRYITSRIGTWLSPGTYWFMLIDMLQRGWLLLRKRSRKKKKKRDFMIK